MANNQTTVPLMPKPGIQRDGTTLDGNSYQDLLWCRFRHGRPKKIGGFREMCHVDGNGADMVGPIRALYPYQQGSGLYYVYCFSGSGIRTLSVDQNGVGSQAGDRTPAGWTPDDIYNWQVDALYDSSGSPGQVIVAHAANNLSAIDDTTDLDVYYGLGSDYNTPLTSVGKQVSGGVCVLQPFVFLYGNNGLILNSDANKPTTYSGGFSNSANVAATKIVKGMALRGGASPPSGLFWSINSLIRVTFTPGGTVNWNYDTVSDQTTILSSNGVVEYDGLFFWAGIDRFLMYNGTVQEVPNFNNQDWFFKNINMNYRQKVWATKIPQWGEIWWHFPMGDSTECNWALIYNVREQCWYDTPIGRSAGWPVRELIFPMWATTQQETDPITGYKSYGLYQHEFGTDGANNGVQVAVRSYFKTPYVGLISGGPTGQPGETPNKNTRIVAVEPDFQQAGDMTMTVYAKSFAQSTNDRIIKDAQTFSPTADEDNPWPTQSSGQAKLDVGKEGRLVSFQFESNTLGGDYLMGRPLVHMEEGSEHAGT